MDSFIVYLSNKDSEKIYTENKYNYFKVDLPHQMNLIGEWEVGVLEINVKTNVDNMNVEKGKDTSKTILDIKESTKPDEDNVNIADEQDTNERMEDSTDGDNLRDSVYEEIIKIKNIQLNSIKEKENKTFYLCCDFCAESIYSNEFLSILRKVNVQNTTFHREIYMLPIYTHVTRQYLNTLTVWVRDQDVDATHSFSIEKLELTLHFRKVARR